MSSSQERVSIRVNTAQVLYRKHLFEYFGQTNDYEVFMKLVEKEVNSYGICDWAYTLLDLPTKLSAAEQLGTVDESFVSDYVGLGLYEHDMVLHHMQLTDKLRNPIFQSDIENYVNCSPVHTESIECQKTIISRNKSFGLEEICNIPVVSGYDGSRILFCITSKRGAAVDFRESVLKNMDSLRTLALAINDVGIKKHPKVFLSSEKIYESNINPKYIELLATMVNRDLTVVQAAECLEMREGTARNYLTAMRKYFGVKTNHSLLVKANKLGFI